MTIVQKLIISAIIVFGVFIFNKMNRYHMKRHNESGSKNNLWMFSEEGIKIVEYVFIGFGIIWLIMIWTNNADFFLD